MDRQATWFYWCISYGSILYVFKIDDQIFLKKFEIIYTNYAHCNFFSFVFFPYSIQKLKKLKKLFKKNKFLHNKISHNKKYNIITKNYRINFFQTAF